MRKNNERKDVEINDTESEALEDAIVEIDDDTPKKNKNKSSNKTVASLVDVVKTEKKSLIQIAALLLGLIVVAFMANEIVFKENAKAKEYSMLKEGRAQLNAEYVKLMNDIDIFQKTNPYYTGVDPTIGNNNNKDVNWVGTKVDAGRIASDKAYFWNWISPAFDYDSATEYNTNIADFTMSKGLDPNNLFVTTFCKHYDYTSDMAYDSNKDGKLSADEMKVANDSYKCYTSQQRYNEWTRLIGKTASGDYHYLALVPMSTSSTGKYYTMVAFTFTAKHVVNAATNNESITVADFNVWPPHSNGDWQTKIPK